MRLFYRHPETNARWHSKPPDVHLSVFSSQETETVATQISFALETGAHMKTFLHHMKQALLMLVTTSRISEWFFSTSEENREATSD